MKRAQNFTQHCFPLVLERVQALHASITYDPILPRPDMTKYKRPDGTVRKGSVDSSSQSSLSSQGERGSKKSLSSLGATGELGSRGSLDDKERELPKSISMTEQLSQGRGAL